MTEQEIFSLALELEAPWFIEKMEFELEFKTKKLHIYIGHKKRVKFKYESKEYSVYDHQDRTWRHLNFFQHECLLHARVPRIKTEEGKVRLIEVPWAKPSSSFTLLFESQILDLLNGGMSASAIGRHLNIGPKRAFGVAQRYVSHALASQDLENVKELSLDETSSKKGHNYLTILSDREAKKVVGISVGKDKDALAHALLDMEIRGADRTKVRCVTMDMSNSYIAGVNEFISQADIVFDRFHIVKKLNQAVDQIRRLEQKQFHELTKSRYLWLKNNDNLTEEQKEKVSYLADTYPNIGEAYRLKELLKKVLDAAYYDQRLTPLNEWMKMAWDSGLEPIQKFVNMLKNHWYGVKTYFEKLATNALAERINLKIQEIKRVAKGYRNTYNFMIMIYFHLGGLKF